MSKRREFIVQIGLVGATLSASQAWAQSAMVDEGDAQAVALGYKSDATKADKKKFPKYAAAQECRNCSLY